MILRASLAQPQAARWAAAAGITAALAAIVAARWLATRLGVDALLVGAGFGLALVAVWAVASGAAARGRRPGRARVSRAGLRRAARSVAAGIALGLALILVAVAGSSLGGVVAAPGSLRPAAPFAAWALVTLVVVVGEEGILRGVLFDRLRQGAGPAVALALTTVAFALLHVPLYGWEVVPLDLAVGLSLGGLRLATGGVVAPAIAHFVADLATWWL